MGLVVAIDQGTTGTRVAVFDADGSVRGFAYREFAQHFPKPGWVEHDAEEIWRSVAELLPAALKKARVGAGDVRGIGITNQRETVVLWDRTSGRPVGRALVWQDRRTTPECKALRARGLEDHVRRTTGLTIDPYFSATKIAWVLRNVPGAAALAARGELAAGTIDSWVIYNLTGGARGGAHVTEVSNASRTMLYDIHRARWDPELLGALDIPEDILPEVRASSEVYAQAGVADVPGLSAPVCGAAGDQQAALFGQCCHAPGLAKNTYGTGSFLLLNTGEKAVESRSRLLTTIAWRLAGAPVQYALEGSIFVTGAAVQWLRDGLGIITDAGETESLAASLSSNDGVYFVPALTGLGAPHWDPEARGAILGLTRGTNRAHLVRAALEAMAYQSLDVARAMENDSGIGLASLRADGGAARNAFLMQFQADMLGVPVEVPEITETTALGAAYLAGLAVGVWAGTDELARHCKLARRYEPRMPEAERHALHGRWLEAVARAGAWEHG